MRLHDLLSRLPNRRQRDGSYMAQCPAHEDKQYSLHITPKPGRALLHCFAGCDVRAIVKRLGLTMRDLETDR